MTVAAPIDMTTFTNTIAASWFADATGLTTIWMDQSAPRPDYPYAALKIISGPLEASPVWEQRHDYDAGRPAGEELKFTSCVPCSFMVEAQTYVAVPASRSPLTDALSYMLKAQSALAMPTYRSTFVANSIAVIARGTVNNITDFVDTDYISRASMEVQFGTTLNAISYETYIERVQLSSTSLGIDMEVSL